MNMMRRYLWVGLISLALFALGCSRSGFGGRSDSQILSDVQNRINADGNVPDKQIGINSNNGVVTLSGNVANDMARNAAANDAGQVEGVKTVVNNLQVGTTAADVQPQQLTPAQPPMTATAEPPRYEPRATTTRARRRASARDYSDNSNSGDNGLRTTVPSSNDTSSNTASNGSSNNYEPSHGTPVPAAPVKVTIPAGTGLTIRVNEEVSSEKAQVGDIFHGSITTPVTIDDQTVVPTSADVEGRVVEVKSAGRFAGQSVLTLELTRLMMNGKSYNLQTDRWSKSGNGRGKSTAAKVGGGAAVGAILGGIFGGGKGAAIGAAAGAGAGTGVSAINKGQQIVLRPETILNFQMQNSITVTPGASRQSMGQ
jgi:hypothetical protein